MPDEPAPPPSSEIVFYQSEDGQSRVQVRLEGGTAWLTQRQIAALYQVAVPTVNEHLTNLFEESEVDPGPTVRKFRIVQTEGSRDVTRVVALDAYDAFDRRRLAEEAAAPDEFEAEARRLTGSKKDEDS